ncbi:hypothetical protein [Paenibacillus periandrae]|nr:hypothetical protein [Paenibacillus periandrae]
MFRKGHYDFHLAADIPSTWNDSATQAIGIIGGLLLDRKQSAT